MSAKSDPKKLYTGERLTCRAEVEGRVFNFELQLQDLDKYGLVVPVPQLGGPRLEVGQELLVRYYRSDSAYQFLSRVIQDPDAIPPVRDEEGDEEPEEEEPPQHLYLSFPRQITRYQRREHGRRKLEGVVRFVLPGKEEQPGRGFLYDLSAGGLQFVTHQTAMFTPNSPWVGKELIVDLTVTGGPSFKALRGQIRRVVEEPSAKGSVRVQLGFVEDMGERTRDRIEQALRKHGKTSS